VRGLPEETAVDDVTDIRAFYDNALSEEGRLDRHQLEWDVTWRYLADYLPDSGHILEVGAATGRYSRELARRGYRVTAVDLSPALTEWSRERCREEGLGARVRHVVADARDLSSLGGERFDAALLMGPLYHLVYEQDRRAALREVAGLLAPGGVLVSAHICRLGILAGEMSEFSDWVLSRDCASVMAVGYDTEEQPKSGTGFRGYFCRPEELAPLHEAEGFETLVVAAAEPCIGADDAPYNALKGEERRAWLDLLYRVSAEPSLLGGSRHLLYLGKNSRGVQTPR